ncbi:MAG: family NAD(P)-dependent oxidoreductase [Actinomycetia bacterium]|nr:family NAD(P)-dependent oxidoreductase [Actinomycetes bacterium]
MQEFEGRTAVVTGAASGIGNAIARRLAAAGMSIVLADIESGPLGAAAAEIAASGVPALAVVTDVSDAGSVDALAAAARDAFGPVHVLVNNAGVGNRGRAWELSVDDWRWVHGVCFWGVVHGIASFVPGMIASSEEGHIVNTSSMMGLGTAAEGGPYQSAKHAVTALTETLAFDLAEVAPQIKATLLCPGYVDTRIADSARNRPGAPGPLPAANIAAAQPGSAVPVPPEGIAELAFDAIVRERFYALADWDIWRPLVASRFDAILDADSPAPVRLP